MTAWDCQSKRIFDINGKSPTLQGGVGGGVNNPAIFAAIPINDKATRWQGGGERRNHDGSGNGLGIGKEGDPSPTLTAGDRHGVMCMTPWDAQAQRVYDGNGVAPTLSSRENSGLNRQAVLHAAFKPGNSEQARSIGYQEELSPTLNAECGRNKPAVVAPAVMSYALQGSMIGREDKNWPQGDGVNEEVSFTLNTVDRHAVASQCFDMTHACDVIRECGETAPSLQARMGTGGNQVPLTYGIGNGQANEAQGMVTERAQTLNTMHDAQAVMCVSPAHALRARSSLANREDAESYIVARDALTVRRLTPLECERLQGFPDGWTDIGDYTDSTGKKRKTSDSARYKALGNSIALPFWRWMFGRMAAYLPEGATLGSLFDGIGGFPLCWEDVHGAGTAVWASEIEEFPIAVTKKRFGSENMIHYTLNIEPPVEPPAYTCPICPVCGAETDTVYKNVYGDPVGCPECVTEVDAWAE